MSTTTEGSGAGSSVVRLGVLSDFHRGWAAALRMRPNTTCGEVAATWAHHCGLRGYGYLFALYARDPRASRRLPPSTLLRDLISALGRADPPVLMFKAVFEGVYLPPPLLPPLHSAPPPSPTAQQALEMAAPIISAFAVTRPLDLIRFTLVCKAWSQAREEGMLSMLGVEKRLPRCEAAVRGAACLLRSTNWPSGPARAAICHPLEYTYVKSYGGQELEVAEGVRCLAAHIAGLTFVHVRSYCTTRMDEVRRDGLYVMRREGDATYPNIFREVCHLQCGGPGGSSGGVSGCWVDVGLWVQLRRHLAGRLGVLAGLRAWQLLLLLFQLAGLQGPPQPPRHHLHGNGSGHGSGKDHAHAYTHGEPQAFYDLVCQAFEGVESLPSYPASEVGAAQRAAPTTPTHARTPLDETAGDGSGVGAKPTVRCEDGTALCAAVARCWTEGLFALHGIYTALRNVKGMAHLSQALQQAREFHLTQSGSPQHHTWPRHCRHLPRRSRPFWNKRPRVSREGDEEGGRGCMGGG